MVLGPIMRRIDADCSLLAVRPFFLFFLLPVFCLNGCWMKLSMSTLLLKIVLDMHEDHLGALHWP